MLLALQIGDHVPREVIPYYIEAMSTLQLTIHPNERNGSTPSCIRYVALKSEISFGIENGKASTTRHLADAAITTCLGG
jgi:hypothetical protein